MATKNLNKLKNTILSIALLSYGLCFSQVQDLKTEDNINVKLNNDGTWTHSKVNSSEDAIILDKFTGWVNPAKDIIKDRNTETYSLNKVIYVNNGLKKSVSVKLLWLFEKEYPNLNLKTINLIILQSNNASKTYCKTLESYTPIGFYVNRSTEKDKGTWTFHTKFKGQTEYGIIGEYDKFFYFDKDGKRL
ncbi:MAG: hypothetical protein COS42_03230 [Flavobacteriales bacterium CG03_land_8_20_14_0_80_35_15]|nr:MAG: hypothetical protein AUJ53_04655 [Flavobacteriaceae bacterium CG1_02_35_72]PIV17759.1 MAG: hypothetical protein COS42_03230 [Flavobacteriales bacterium CG03_land_8_20_14_0_80_35_15]PIX07639.1 MAG: hypothetical protein COZ76_02410 [Flavobacteriales bacterium CG_4_8_14_3_um_filter_35_10]PJA06388.1 MAG: hypothetical protein COX71_02490 [Flavobacteriales bacterium CG_4_10_14_0_2_um_filter_35_18]